MAVRYFALILGIAFLLIGIAGFIPALVVDPHAGHPDLAVEAGHGRLLGLFPINVLHNLVHVLFGVWGIIAYRTFDASRLYAAVVAIAYGLLTIMGLLPTPLNTTFGLVPIHGHDVWLHLVIAVAAAYFAFVPQRATTAAAEEPRTI